MCSFHNAIFEMESQYYWVQVIIIVLFYMGIGKQGIVGYSFTYSINLLFCCRYGCQKEDRELVRLMLVRAVGLSTLAAHCSDWTARRISLSKEKQLSVSCSRGAVNWWTSTYLSTLLSGSIMKWNKLFFWCCFMTALALSARTLRSAG